MSSLIVLPSELHRMATVTQEIKFTVPVNLLTTIIHPIYYSTRDFHFLPTLHMACHLFVKILILTWIQ